MRREYPDTLTELRAGGFVPRVEGEPGAEILKIRGPRDPVTGELVGLPQALRIKVRCDSQAIVDQLIAEHWTDRHDELFQQFRRHYPADEAERQAYQNTLWEFHCAQIKGPSRIQARSFCRFCGELFASPGFPAGDGAYLHADCAKNYAEWWRCEAVAGLASLGIVMDGDISPLDEEPDAQEET